MPISLEKGGNLSLSRAVPGLSKIEVGLGWDARTTEGSQFDLDAIAFLLGESGRVRGDADFIFFNNPKSADGCVEHMGDNITGIGDGDDEVIEINLKGISIDIAKITIAVSIHEADIRKLNFGMVNNAFVRVADKVSTEEIVRYDLSEDFSVETALIFGEVYRHGGEWKFRAVGQGYQGGLAAMARSFGVNV